MDSTYVESSTSSELVGWAKIFTKWPKQISKEKKENVRDCMDYESKNIYKKAKVKYKISLLQHLELSGKLRVYIRTGSLTTQNNSDKSIFRIK
jgi:hypothetical protein